MNDENKEDRQLSFTQDIDFFPLKIWHLQSLQYRIYTWQGISFWSPMCKFFVPLSIWLVVDTKYQTLLWEFFQWMLQNDKITEYLDTELSSFIANFITILAVLVNGKEVTALAKASWTQYQDPQRRGMTADDVTLLDLYKIIFRRQRLIMMYSWASWPRYGTQKGFIWLCVKDVTCEKIFVCVASATKLINIRSVFAHAGFVHMHCDCIMQLNSALHNITLSQNICFFQSMELTKQKAAGKRIISTS